MRTGSSDSHNNDAAAAVVNLLTLPFSAVGNAATALGILPRTASAATPSRRGGADAVLRTHADVLLQLVRFTDIDFVFMGWFRLRVSLTCGQGKHARAGKLIACGMRPAEEGGEPDDDDDRRGGGGGRRVGAMRWRVANESSCEEGCGDDEGGTVEYVSGWLAAPLVHAAEPVLDSSSSRTAEGSRRRRFE